jgi:hypothetical protein
MLREETRTEAVLAYKRARPSIPPTGRPLRRLGWPCRLTLAQFRAQVITRCDSFDVSVDTQYVNTNRKMGRGME